MYKVCKWLLIIWTAVCLVWLLAAMVSVSKSISPGASEAEKTGAGLGLFVAMGTVVVVWFFPAVGLGILALVGKRHSATKDEQQPKLCRNCGKYYAGSPSYCPNCGHAIDGSNQSS